MSVVCETEVSEDFGNVSSVLDVGDGDADSEINV